MGIAWASFYMVWEFGVGVGRLLPAAAGQVRPSEKRRKTNPNIGLIRKYTQVHGRAHALRKRTLYLRT